MSCGIELAQYIGCNIDTAVATNIGIGVATRIEVGELGEGSVIFTPLGTVDQVSILSELDGIADHDRGIIIRRGSDGLVVGSDGLAVGSDGLINRAPTSSAPIK